MPRISGAHGGAETYLVAPFSNHNDVWVLAQNVFQGVVKGERVQTYFALLDHGLVVFEDIFDWVLKGNDMLFKVSVDMLDHCRQGRRFPASSGAGNQHNSTRRFGDFLNLGQQS